MLHRLLLGVDGVGVWDFVEVVRDQSHQVKHFLFDWNFGGCSFVLVHVFAGDEYATTRLLVGL